MKLSTRILSKAGKIPPDGSQAPGTAPAHEVPPLEAGPPGRDLQRGRQWAQTPLLSQADGGRTWLIYSKPGMAP